MKTVDQIRRENLELLRKEAGGVGKLAAKLGRSDSQISQWLNASNHSETGRPRGMRPESCRIIEEQMGKPPGWMDQDNGAAAFAVAEDPISASDASLLISLFGKANQQGRKAILDLATAVSKLPPSE